MRHLKLLVLSLLCLIGLQGNVTKAITAYDIAGNTVMSTQAGVDIVENGVDAQNALQLLAGIGGTGTAIYSNKSVLNASDIETPALQVGGKNLISEATQNNLDSIANPFPLNGTFSRVMPQKYAEAFARGDGFLAQGDEVFIGAFDDLADISTRLGAQQKLTLFDDFDATIPNLDGDTVVTFQINDLFRVGIRSPTEFDAPRGYGFQYGGKTKEEAREWLIDNGNASDLGIYNIQLLPLK